MSPIRAASLAALLTVPAAAAGEAPLEERVEVRVVLVDVLATDARGRTVTDLGPDDFTLLVDFREVAVDSVDLDCPAGATDDPRMVDEPSRRPAPGDHATRRRLVIAVDYLHLGRIDRVALLTALRESLPAVLGPDDETMIVAIANEVRVEQTFTSDVGTLVAVLERMENDITLWQPSFDRLTEYGFFRKLGRLLVVLESTPGPEALVLYSNHPGEADELDPQFAAVAAAATAARVTIYPVHAAGLQAPDAADPTSTRLGGPRALARLAVDTGGRMTRNTNDMSLGPARARRDLGCRYTLGFRDDRPADDSPRRITVRVARDGVRLGYAEHYAFRNPDDEREAVTEAALVAPEVFAGGAVRARALLWRPVSARRWEVLLVVETPAEAAGGAAVLTTELARRTGVTELRVARGLGALAAPPDGSPLRLGGSAIVRPGRYRLSTVLARRDRRPEADVVELVVPDLRRDGRVLVGPLLGAPRGPAAWPPLSAEPEAGPALPPAGAPLPPAGDRVARGDALAALARVCAIGEPSGAPRLGLAPSGGGGPVPLGGSVERDDVGGVSCTTVVAPIATGELAAGPWSVVAAAGPLRSTSSFVVADTR